MRKRNWIQLLFVFLFNSDIAVFIKAAISKKAQISSSPLKNLCIPGLNCYSCPSAIGSCPLGSLQFYLNETAMKLRLGETVNFVGLYLLGFFTGTGVLAGRLFCGWVCPFGSLQEWINRITRENRKIPELLTHGRYFTFIVFVVLLPLALCDLSLLSPWFCKLICPAGTLTAGLPLLLMDASLRAAASFITFLKFSILIFILVTLLFSNRTFCKTLCPLGALWGLFNKISLFRLNHQKEKCISCQKCTRICQMNLSVTTEYNSSKCIRCLECIRVCPTHSLWYGLEKKERGQKTV